MLFILWLHLVFIAAHASLVAAGRGYSLAAVWGLFIAVASPAAEHRLQTHGLQLLWLAGSRAWAQELRHEGSVAPWHVESSQTRDQTHVLCIGRQILNQLTTREVPLSSS